MNLRYSKKSPDQLCFQGVLHEELEPILDFMYTGRAFVKDDSLKETLRVAQDLKVKLFIEEVDNNKGQFLQHQQLFESIKDIIEKGLQEQSEMSEKGNFCMPSIKTEPMEEDNHCVENQTENNPVYIRQNYCWYFLARRVIY